MSTDAFYEEHREQSFVKSTIVAKYFWAWAKVIISFAKKKGIPRIAYIDLFSGPGHYEDGTESTPLIVLRRAIQDQDMSKMLVTIFNDLNPSYTSALTTSIDSLPGVDTLSHKPRVHNVQVGADVTQLFERMSMVPSLLFIDPWGYKGLSLRLISSVLKNWGCDCIFFFNYNRISMGLNNPVVKSRMDELFGASRADTLREQLRLLQSSKREEAIVAAITEALKESGGKYVQAFRFMSEGKSRTSHHIIFVTKNDTGYRIMKDIMAKASSGAEQGVPTYEYNPATLSQQSMPLQQSFLESPGPLDLLADALLTEFVGKTMRMVEIYNQHHIGKPYIKSNYKEVLVRLEAEGKITAKPPAEQRPKFNGKSTFADAVWVTFPS